MKISPKYLIGKTVDIGDGILIYVKYASEESPDMIKHQDGSISYPDRVIYFGPSSYSRYRFTRGCKIKY